MYAFSRDTVNWFSCMQFFISKMPKLQLMVQSVQISCGMREPDLKTLNWTS